MTDTGNLDDDYAQGNNKQKKVPSSTTALVCGIISIPFAGIIGIILGIVALSFANTAISKFDASPDQYTQSSLNNAKAGRVCGIIGLVGSVLWLIYVFGNM